MPTACDRANRIICPNREEDSRRYTTLTPELYRVILRGMKTAISLPDDLFVLADQFARDLGMSRSEFYATALRAFITSQQRESLTDSINAACSKLDTTLPADLAKMTRRKLLEVAW